jgi:hypothetical protein
MSIGKYISIALIALLISCGKSDKVRTGNSNSIVGELVQEKLNDFEQHTEINVQNRLKYLRKEQPYYISLYEQNHIDHLDSLNILVGNHCKKVTSQIEALKVTKEEVTSNHIHGLRESLHSLRNQLAEVLVTHPGEKEGMFYKWESDKLDELIDNSDRNKKIFDQNIIKSYRYSDPKDTALIKSICQLLSFPNSVNTNTINFAWSDVILINSNTSELSLQLSILTSRIKRAEASLINHITYRHSVGCFSFNKLEIFSFSEHQALTLGTPLNLVVVPCIMDTYFTEIQIVETNNTYPVKASEEYSFYIKPGKPGHNHLEGIAPIKERGTEVWKPFKYDYYVKE